MRAGPSDNTRNKGLNFKLQETRSTMKGLESKSQKYFGFSQTDDDDDDDDDDATVCDAVYSQRRVVNAVLVRINLN